MEGSNFFEEANKGGKKEESFVGAGKDMADYKYPPEIRITELQHNIEKVDEQLQPLKASIEDMVRKVQAAASRIKEIKKDGKKPLVDLADTLDQEMRTEKQRLLDEINGLEKEKQTLQGELDAEFKKLPPKADESFQ